MIPVPNAAPTGQYSIDAPTVLRLERQAQCVGMSVVGFYHSHPESAPAPSELDLELACPGFVYLIVDGAAAQVRAWRLRDDRSGFHELDLLPLAGAA